MTLSSLIIPSPLGDLFAIADEHTLHLLEFADHGELSGRILSIGKRLGFVIPTVGPVLRSTTKDEGICSENEQMSHTSTGQKENKILEQTKKELSEYFEGKRKHFTISLAPHGTPFQMKAWKALEQIPYGETRNYLEEATMIGSPKAVRAIGGANHANHFPILIPCHRVIGKSGKLVGYGGGLDRKIWLLDHEKKHI